METTPQKDSTLPPPEQAHRAYLKGFIVWWAAFLRSILIGKIRCFLACKTTLLFSRGRCHSTTECGRRMFSNDSQFVT
jgi:hypothetical protein